jgi:16S rRNA (cytosine1402-N4)-methyltransferase
LAYYKIDKADGILTDLGVSSHQFDTPERGFSYRFDGPADMRMNSEAGQSAADILNRYSEEELNRIFREFAEINNYRKVSKLILQYRRQNHIETLDHLKTAIHEAVPRNSEFKYWAKIFQALRIEVNREIEVLQDLLRQTPDLLKKGGRLAVLTYHSLEDRPVKNFFKSGNFEGKVEKDVYGNPLCPFRLTETQKPSEEEILRNSRAASAKLRVAEKR